MFNKLKALILLLSFLTVIACSNDNSVLARDEKVTTASNHERDVQEMYRNIDTLKRELPSVIDEVTTLEKIDFDGTTVAFGYRGDISWYKVCKRKESETAMRDVVTVLVLSFIHSVRCLGRGVL